jgi:hypothetical protein
MSQQTQFTNSPGPVLHSGREKAGFESSTLICRPTGAQSA